MTLQHDFAYARRSRLWLTLNELNYQEILVVYCPFMINIMFLGYFIFVCVYPNFSSSPVYFLGAEWRANWVMMVVVKFLEFFTGYFWFQTMFFVISMGLTPMINLMERIDKIDQKIQITSPETLNGKTNLVIFVQSECRVIQLSITCLNISYANLIYMGKILCLLAAIIGTFFGIRHHDDYPVIAYLVMVIGLDAIIVYISIFNNLFQFPELMDNLKTSVLVAQQQWTRSLKVRDDVAIKVKDFTVIRGEGSTDTELEMVVTSERLLKAEMKRTLRSIPALGVKEGGFRLMERQSTLNFLHFYANQVASLLLTF